MEEDEIKFKRAAEDADEAAAATEKDGEYDENDPLNHQPFF